MMMKPLKMTYNSPSGPALHNFTYDSFQERAINALSENSSVLVAAPTGAGKTVIADHVIDLVLSTGKHVIYTAPIKALSNQKYREFSKKYGELVGIITGDVAINPDAPIRIMTTEIYRNSLLDEPDSFKNLSWVIFDEVHYLDDLDRGTVWEESIILTPPSTKFLCLSATVPNINEIAEWFEEILDRRTIVITEYNRPVPLHFRYQCLGEILDGWKKTKKLALNFLTGSNNSRSRFKQRFDYRNRNRRNRNQHKGIKQNRLFPLIKQILNNNELPCIYFAFSRVRTEQLAEEIVRLPFLSEQKQKALDRKYMSLCEVYNITNEPSAKKLRKFIRFGVAYHHAGMLPTLKEVVEQLFNQKLIPLIFTTETFALGINMPARTVVFDALRKYYSTGFDTLHSRDFYQMAGRAGRRGMDTEGFVYVRFVPTRTSPKEIERTIFGDTEPVLSKFNASYATVLNLYEVHGENVIELYPKTLHYFQSTKRGRKRARRKFLNRLLLLKKNGFIKNNLLTKKGHFARWMFGYELYMAEMFESGLLDRFSSQELCFAVSCLVFEPRRGVEMPRKPPKHFQWIERELKHIHRKIHVDEVVNEIEPHVPPPHPQMGFAVDAWVKGLDFDEIVDISRLDEGALVRYLRMINQLLRQIVQAPYTSDSLRAIAHDARKLINRDVVDAEKQLRVEIG